VSQGFAGKCEFKYQSYKEHQIDLLIYTKNRRHDDEDKIENYEIEPHHIDENIDQSSRNLRGSNKNNNHVEIVDERDRSLVKDDSRIGIKTNQYKELEMTNVKSNKNNSSLKEATEKTAEVEQPKKKFGGFKNKKNQ
jgi:hypothetical protein